ncbi:DNA methylase N-4 [Erythrobacter arachoides]|uniref:Methyltransferase n=1 Tax=Aurantiacibacter arachoides TaxID=1850444 RepID=A0A845A1G7_9SPHN|nr:DNA methyltransferase [Aurantiacibacter arachoides]MXO94383.1 DNA methylase N-4 [Aurantiacibacter arachoides]GGD63906.1 methyltransferase [Aurantiacibacter arachoides]
MSFSQPHNSLAVDYRPIDAIAPYAHNARKHSRTQIRKLQQSLKHFGWTNPLLVDESGNLVCGHGRLEAAKLNGETHVPVISLGAMSEEDRRAYIIADNRLAEDASWSKELLRSELSGLIELGYDVELTGFDTFEIDGILSFDEAGEGAEEDRVDLPDEDKVPVCRVGDFWKIGDQWLGVGDCRDQDFVERLLAGNRVRLVQTDPPYGCRIAGNVSGNGKVRHSNFVAGAGEVSLPEFAMTLLRPAFKAIAPHCSPGAIAFVWTDWRACPHMLNAAQGVFHELKNQIVWAKDPGMGAFYRSAYELCLAFKVSPGAHTSNIALGRRNRSNLWRYPSANAFHKGRLQDLADHPTIKNRRMIADAILDVTKPGDVVFDGFAGSGTTLAASAMTGRRGFGIELDPKYADVILRRVGEATASEPLLNGEVPLSQVMTQRAGDRS